MPLEHRTKRAFRHGIGSNGGNSGVWDCKLACPRFDKYRFIGALNSPNVPRVGMRMAMRNTGYQQAAEWQILNGGANGDLVARDGDIWFCKSFHGLFAVSDMPQLPPAPPPPVRPPPPVKAAAIIWTAFAVSLVFLAVSFA